MARETLTEKLARYAEEIVNLDIKNKNLELELKELNKYYDEKSRALKNLSSYVNDMGEDFERVLNKALEYAEKDTVFTHNKTIMLEIRAKYFGERL